jgi:hypothetical protein
MLIRVVGRKVSLMQTSGTKAGAISSHMTPSEARARAADLVRCADEIDQPALTLLGIPVRLDPTMAPDEFRFVTPGAPAAQATVPAGGGRDLAADIARAIAALETRPDIAVRPSDFIATELQRLGYGLGGGLSDGARQALLMLVDIYDGRALDRDRLASARAEIEALPRAEART